MATLTPQEFTDAINAAFDNNDDAVNAVLGLGYQWRQLKARAEAAAARAQAAAATQQAESLVQQATAIENTASSEFVAFIATLGAAE